MFAFLLPAGAALVVSIKKRVDAHAQFAAAERRQKQAAELRGAAAGALPDAEVELWRGKAALATERIKGLETTITVRAGTAAASAQAGRRQRAGWQLASFARNGLNRPAATRAACGCLRLAHSCPRHARGCRLQAVRAPGCPGADRVVEGGPPAVTPPAHPAPRMHAGDHQAAGPGGEGAHRGRRGGWREAVGD
jgi:hypothetical protein